MKIVTDWVHADEPCHGLREEPRLMQLADGSQAWRWVQTVFVIRGDAIASHAVDLGPVEDFKDVVTLMMPSFGENTVAQLREHADKNRSDTYWSQRARVLQGESTLIKDHIEQIEMARTYARRNHRTVKELH